MTDDLNQETSIESSAESEAGTAGGADVAADGLGPVQSAVKAEVQNFKREIGAVLEVLLAQLQATHQGLQQQTVDAAAEISEEIGRQGDAAFRRIELAANQASTRVHATEEQLSRQGAGYIPMMTVEKGANSQNVFVERLLNEIRGRSDAATPNLAQQLQAAVAAAVAAGVEDARRQIAGLAAEQTESSKRDLESGSEAHRLELKKLHEQMAESGFREVKARAADLLKKEGKGFEKCVKDLVASQLDWLESTFDAPGRGVLRFPTRLVAFLMFLAMTPALFCLYLNLRPVSQLQPDPPADFFDSHPAWGTKRFQPGDSRWLLTDRVVARAYWDWAARHLERKYPFGARLPDNPPLEMQVEGIGFPEGLESEFAKVHYWQKLQKVWNEPQSWQTVTGWDALP